MIINQEEQTQHFLFKNTDGGNLSGLTLIKGGAQNFTQSERTRKRKALNIIPHNLSEFIHQQTVSTSDYPSKYETKSIFEQIVSVANRYRLSPKDSLIFYEEVIAKRPLCSGAEARFAVASPVALAQKYFPRVNNFDSYALRLQIVLKEIRKSRHFCNWRAGQLTSERLGQQTRTLVALSLISREQLGDIWVIDAQFGRYHAGQSVNYSRELIGNTVNEFGLDAASVGDMILENPDRFVDGHELSVDCPGDEFRLENDSISLVPGFGFSEGKLVFGAYSVSGYFGCAGSVSAFLAPETLALWENGQIFK
ncbi:MAG: hypothetical protein WC863_03100 [Patescibacteria group bacterium]